MVGGEGVKRRGQRCGGEEDREGTECVCEREAKQFPKMAQKKVEGSQALQPDRAGFKSSLGRMNLGNRQRFVCNWG